MTRRYLTGLLALVFLLVPASRSLARQKEPAEPKKVTSVEGITEYRLDNGLRVLLFPDNSRPRLTVALTVFVGSRHEGYGETGMAHLLEHMVFKGTPMHPRIDKVLRERGATYNGTTNPDRTNYYETLPASDDNLEFAIRFEADRLVNSFIRRDDLVSEMTVVRNEFEQGENSPRSILDQRITATAFEWHNYGKSTIGNRSDIERVPIENLQAFYRKHYQPDNAMLVVAGRFDEKKALGFVRKYFGAIPRPERKLSDTYTEEPPQDGERTVTLRRVGDVGLVGMAYHVPPGSHPDVAALEVLSRILSSTPSGRLYKALVETRKATNVTAYADRQYDPGLFSIMVGTPSGEGLPAVRDEITRVLDEVVAKGVTEAEVKRAVQELMTARERQAANSSTFAVSLSNWAAQGDWRLYFLHRDRLEKVKAEDVKAAAGRYLRVNNRTVGFYVPTKTPERISVPGRPDVATLVKEYKGREAVSQGEVFDPSWENIGKRVRQSALEGGVKTALLPVKTRGQTVSLQLALHYGDEQSLREYRTAAEILPRLMTRGTKKLSYTQLREELDRQKATLTAFGETGTLVFNVQTRRENLPAVLELLRQVLREPALKAEEFEVLKKQELARLQQWRTDPIFLTLNRLRREMLPWPKDNVRHVMTLDEEAAAVKALTAEQVEKLYREFVNGRHGEVAVVGDFDPDACLEGLGKALNGWKAAKPYARIEERVAPGGKPGRHVIETPDKANAVFRAGLVFAMGEDHPDYPALSMADYFLGAGPGSRLWDRVREKEGLSYGIGSRLIVAPRDPSARFGIQGITNPQNVEKVQKAVLEEVRRLAKEGLTKDELTRAVRGYLDSERTSRSNEGQLAGQLVDTLEAGRTAKYHVELERKLKALTPEQVRAAFQKYVDPAKMVIVVGGDFAKVKKGS